MYIQEQGAKVLAVSWCWSVQTEACPIRWKNWRYARAHLYQRESHVFIIWAASLIRPRFMWSSYPIGSVLFIALVLVWCYAMIRCIQYTRLFVSSSSIFHMGFNISQCIAYQSRPVDMILIFNWIFCLFFPFFFVIKDALRLCQNGRGSQWWNCLLIPSYFMRTNVCPSTVLVVLNIFL